MRRLSPSLSILPMVAAALFLLVAAPAGCRKAQQSAPQACTAPGSKGFGEVCNGPCDCGSGLCWEFGDGQRACSKRCTGASECPSGSRGKKCSKQGVCRT